MGVPAPHVPVPLQVPALVSVLPEQVAEPQAVLDAACWQTPPAAQLPVFPHGGAAVHWPAGAGARFPLALVPPSPWEAGRVATRPRDPIRLIVAD